MILLCIFLPPVAVLLCGKPFKAFICLLLCFLAWFPGVIYALMTYNNHKQDKRFRNLSRQMGSR